MDPACKSLIEELIQVKPKDRLGASGTDHDMLHLMDHEFFNPIDWNADLAQLDVEEILTRKVPMKVQTKTSYPSEEHYSAGKTGQVVLERKRVHAARIELENQLDTLPADEPILTGWLLK